MHTSHSFDLPIGSAPVTGAGPRWMLAAALVLAGLEVLVAGFVALDAHRTIEHNPLNAIGYYVAGWLGAWAAAALIVGTVAGLARSGVTRRGAGATLALAVFPLAAPLTVVLLGMVLGSV